MRRAIMILSFLAGLAPARADVTVGVRLTPDGAALAQRMGMSPDQLAAQLHDRIAARLGATDLGSFADASVASTHGLGVDYVSMPESLMVGVAANAAQSDDPSGLGVAANVSLMAGLNLSAFRHPRWTVFASGFYRDASVAGYDGSIANAGAHVQYALIPRAGGGVAAWTGLQLTTGLELTRWRLGTGKAMSSSLAINGTDIGFDAMGRVDATARSLTVPIELSTGVRVAVVDVYGGIGIDLTASDAALDAAVDGTLYDSDGRNLGTVTATGHASHGGTPVSPRGLAGVQLEAWKLKIFGQVNASPDTPTSAGVGVRGVM